MEKRDTVTAPNPQALTIMRLVDALITAAIFFAAFILAYFLAGHVALPFSNPNGIVGTLTVIRYSTWNNIARFLFMTSLPTLTLAIVFLTAPRTLVSRLFGSPAPETFTMPPRRTLWRVLVVPALIITTLLVALDAQAYMSVGALETFEEGLPLSAGMSYLSGGTPYRDFATYHGLYDEPLRVAVAFKLFRPSIGAMRTIQNINKIVVFALLAWFLFRIFRGNSICVLFVVLLLHRLEPAGKYLSVNRAGIVDLHSIIIMPRDIAVFGFLVLLTFLAEKLRPGRSNDKSTFWIAAAWSAVPVLGYIHSMERGVYLIVAFAIIAPACYFLFFRGGPVARPFVLGCVLGFSLSSALLAVLIRGALKEMVRLTAFVASPRITLQFGHPYPYTEPRHILIGLMIAFNCFWIFRMFFVNWHAANNFREGLKNCLRQHFTETALLLLSMLFYRNALGRSDWIHVAYVLPIPTILFLFIAIRYFVLPMSRTIAGLDISRLKMLFVAALWFLVAAQDVAILGKIPQKNLLGENFPLAKEDSAYLPERWKQVVGFLRDNLSNGESFFTLSDELSIYYFVGKVCPVRFSLLNLVARDERYQREIIADLQAHHVKYVVEDPNGDYSHLDGFSNEVRAPLVFEYVRENYQPSREIDGQMIWVRSPH